MPGNIPDHHIQEWKELGKQIQGLQAQDVYKQLSTHKQKVAQQNAVVQRKKKELEEMDKAVKKAKKADKKINRVGATRFKARIKGELSEKEH